MSMAVTSALLLSLFRELLGLHLLFEFADVLELLRVQKALQRPRRE